MGMAAPTSPSPTSPPDAPRVALFVTCLVDMFRPTVGFAAIRLLEQAGCRVEVPLSQTCCGQPAFNSGDRATAADLARNVIEAFAGYDYVVAPSGSCAGQIHAHFAELLADDPNWAGRAAALGEKTFELVSFLTDVMGMQAVTARHPGSVTYHDSCSGLRELGVKTQPRALLARVPGLALREMTDCEVCCGFGGTFAVKYGEVSAQMADTKCGHIAASGADAVVLGDLGCMLNIEGRLRKRGDNRTRVLHVAEVLAGPEQA